MKKLVALLAIIWQVGIAQNDKFISTFTGHGNLIHAVAYSPDRKTIASASEDQTIKLWDALTGNCLKTFKGHKNAVFSITYNQTGNLLASGCYDGTIKIWNIDNGKCIKTLEGHTGGVRALFFDEFYPSEYLFSASIDGTVKKWNIEKGECLKTFTGHTSGIMCMDYFNHKIITGSADKTAKLWNYDTGECLKTFNGHAGPVTSVAFVNNGKEVVSGSEDKTIRLWNYDISEAVKTYTGHKGFVLSLDVDNEATTIVSGATDNTVKLWYLHADTAAKTLKGHTNWVWCVAFSKDGFRVASGGLDSTVKQWNVSEITNKAYSRRKFDTPSYADKSSVKGEFFTTDDGYKAVKIGNQVWMAENLTIDHYRNGDPIVPITDAKMWADTFKKEGAYCYYNNDPENDLKYGKLYNAYAAKDPRGLAPKGWHIPTDDEWRLLFDTVGAWAIPKIASNIGGSPMSNSSGFSAVQAGYRKQDGSFDGFPWAGFYTSSSATAFNLAAYILDITLEPDRITAPNNLGLSIRCIKD